MKELLERVCKLQEDYSDANTPEMQARGLIIRNDIPAFLNQHRTDLSGALNISQRQLGIEGRDATGRKSRVPWVRYYWEEASPNAHTGWYCVYLFRAQADGVFLTLNHASTRWELGSLLTLPKAEVSEYMKWSRGILEKEIQNNPDLTTQVQLSNHKLAAAYARTATVGKFYPATAIPPNAELVADALRLAGLLSRIYQEDRLGRGPNATNLEAERSQAQLTRQMRGDPGQGYGLSAGERRAVELRSMEAAKVKLRELGFTNITDTSNGRPFDYQAQRNGKSHIVEVKGTTGRGETVILTRNEVEMQRAAYPLNVLIVVSGILLERLPDAGERATGGEVKALIGWDITSDSLTALSYQHRVPCMK